MFRALHCIAARPCAVCRVNMGKLSVCEPSTRWKNATEVVNGADWVREMQRKRNKVQINLCQPIAIYVAVSFRLKTRQNRQDALAFAR